MKMVWWGALTLFAGCAGGGDVNGQDGPVSETARFLGPTERWRAAQLELRDVHGLWGGIDVHVRGDGHAVVRKVDQSQEERRHALRIGAARAHELLELAVELDLLGVEVPERAGVPDEARPTLVLRSPAGEARSVAKWEGQEVPPLDRVLGALRAIGEEAEDGELVWTGPYERDWAPWRPGVEVTVSMYSGRPDPRWELTDPAEVRAVLERLEDLPEAEPVPRPGLGYRGFRLHLRGVEGAPAPLVEVFRGTVLLQQRDGSSVTRADARALETWLREAAAARGIDVPE